jgi:hypothetical protein
MTGRAPGPGLKASLFIGLKFSKDKEMTQIWPSAGPGQLPRIKNCLLDIAFRQYIFNL